MPSIRQTHAQLVPGSTLEDLYEVPAEWGVGNPAPPVLDVVVSVLVVCNQAATTPTFTIAIVPGGVTTTVQHYLHFTQPMTANQTLYLGRGLTLDVGDVLRVASTGIVSFGLFGQLNYQ